MRRFNPHPSRRTGATSPGAGSGAGCGRFNPHPSRRTGATSSDWAPLSLLVESFNPHPSRRTGATLPDTSGMRTCFCVSILTRPEGRVQPKPNDRFCVRHWFQSSPVPKDGCNACARAGNREASVRFQSSPVPKDGCNWKTCATGAGGWMFQSSPVPKDGCNPHTRRFAKEAPGFNPHPSRRTGATMPTSRKRAKSAESFNPHPSRRTGATRWARPHAAAEDEFQSSPVPKDGCNGSSLRWDVMQRLGFNPHPSRRTGATRSGQLADKPAAGRFNPHPSRRTGAT